MITTLTITSIDRYALEHPNRAVADAFALSQDRCCCQPTITEQTNDAIVRTLLSP